MPLRLIASLSISSIILDDSPGSITIDPSLVVTNQYNCHQMLLMVLHLSYANFNLIL